MKKIYKITVHNLTDYYVGKHTMFKKEDGSSVFGEITEIIDISNPYGSPLHNAYQVYGKNNQSLILIENCPVVIEYFYEEE